MQIFYVNQEVTKKTRECAYCKQMIEKGKPMFFGHTSLPKDDPKECSQWVCKDCAMSKDGYIKDCNCMSYL